ncbi:M24 family metallopeptidase [Microbacterium marinilacus]|uniref:M24 family metallopeptidase n=1 Tax=Microbacterium marinilacus TaxID=415209 RepID=A0ABP7B9S4_9MICO|nr:M24 family metallopeptidase [Microbacterium marinilacus]MBY0687307.1 M24 family metallopeptidase [Microbacterium marinilacus]
MTLLSAQPASADRPLKHARLVDILDERGADRILLTSPEALAWYFDGPRTGVPLGGPPVFAATVHRDGSAVVTAPANEADRLAAEEVPGAEFRVVDWYDDLSTTEPGVLRDADVADELRAARAVLLPLELGRYRALGRDMARVMTEVLARVTPQTTERELAGLLVRGAFAAGAEPSVALVAGASRGHVPHPLPTDAPLGARAMAVLTGRRHGLHVSLTRWVLLAGADGGAWTDAEQRLQEVEADAWAATRPGRPMGDVLGDIAAAYEAHGFGADAWLAHHQGGPTGYAGRDPKAGPATSALVHAGQAFAWNPWAPGVKAEDTVVIAPDGVEVLSLDPAWPTVDVRGVARPLPLDLS